MKRIATLIVAATLLAVTSHAHAAEPSRANLTSMGLPGLRVMSDVEGAKVKGSGPSLTPAGAFLRNITIGLATGPNFGYPAANVVVAGGFSAARQ
jgi:hypothetical protein